MRKKLLIGISAILLVSSFVLISQFQEKNFRVFNSVSSGYAEKLKQKLPETEKLSFTALLCNGIRVPYDENTKTFYVSLSMEDEAWEKMEFLSGQPEYQILFEEDVTDYDKLDVIAGNQKFPLMVYDTQSWATYYVCFSGLPMIDLSTQEGFWAEEIEGTAVFYDQDFTLNGTQESDYHGHIRGNTSRMFPKKGYKINLTKEGKDGVRMQNKLSLFQMRKDDDWILYALYNDDTKIRDRVSMEIWDKMGATEVSEKAYYGTRMTYVEVFADNSYCGLYGLMERVDAKQLDLDSKDYLYKRKESSGLNYENFRDEKDPYAMVSGFEIKAGEMTESAWEAMAELARVTYASEEEYQNSIGELVDTDNLTRMWLFLQIITGHDHTAKNIFYVAQKEEDAYRFSFAPWDMDLTWGNVSAGETNPYYTEFKPEVVDTIVRWETGTRFIEQNVDGSMQKMQELYTELRQTILTDEAMESIILEEDQKVRDSGAFARDQERWPEGTHAEDCGQLVEYAVDRLHFLDEALYDFSLFTN